MPVSVNPEESFQNTVSILRRRVQTTKQMVENALIELHSTNGTTLKQIYSFISTKHNIEPLSKRRIALIKKHLKTLRELEDIVNKKGKGLVGHFKLADKRKFIKKMLKTERQARANNTVSRQPKPSTANEVKSIGKIASRNSKTKVVKRTIRKVRKNIKETAVVIPRQATPISSIYDSLSMFDTPMVSTQVHNSTPSVSSTLIPWAPDIKKTSKRRKLDQLGSDTPRSSIPGKKRNLINIPE